MTTILKMTQQMTNEIRADLRRQHEFAYERVGFLYCKQSPFRCGDLLLAVRYVPILDEQYIADSTVGARFDSSSIRAAMQFALTEGLAVVHVHLHDHPGSPRFSSTDKREMQALMPCFVNLCPDRIHGALVLSSDSAIARVWTVEHQFGQPLDKIVFVGPTMTFLENCDGRAF